MTRVMAKSVKSKPGGSPRRKGGFKGYRAGEAKGKDLVIVESPAKAKTINKYLGPGYHVMASVGHVRDLPARNPKGVKSPVPGVDLEKDFRPTYVVTPDREDVIRDIKKAAKDSESTGHGVWFATDLDREGEAIAWHLAQELGIPSSRARRVIFAAITKKEIEQAFRNPHAIDEDRVNAQQARRILDRIVGYQVSPLLWKKVARGLSAGRVQSVAVRLVVERERAIRAFVPDEEWSISGFFTLQASKAGELDGEWEALLARRDEKGNGPTVKDRQAWLGARGVIVGELVEFAGEKFEASIRVDGIIGAAGESAGLTNESIRARLDRAAEAFADPTSHDLSGRLAEVASGCGLRDARIDREEAEDGRGPSRWIRRVSGKADPSFAWAVESIETRRVKVRAPAPFITSTLQQAASTRLGFGAQRTMRAAQQLYEGVEIPGEGPVGLITYMRTDSTHLSGDALEMARRHIGAVYGGAYLPEKPNFFTSSNKDAQQAHEAIRPTNVELTPSRVKAALTPDQFRLYQVVWERFVACQMTPAEWDSTVVMIRGQAPGRALFKSTGRVLAFDGWYRVAGIPQGDEATLPRVDERQALHAWRIEPRQRFTQGPARYSEAGLIKVLESEGIGRPSTYASIISTIQDRKYVELTQRRFFATDLGEVVTDKLIEAIPDIMDLGYTRDMEKELDKVEEDHIDWVEMLRRFYGPFRKSLKAAEETLVHAKAETTPAPDDLRCPDCGAPTVYRFGKNGRFLSCSRYPECKHASPVDREGRPRAAVETVDVACHKCGSAMTRRTGRFGVFLGCSRYGDKVSPCDGILNVDRKGKVVAPSIPPLATDLPCPTCESPLNLRAGLRGPWLGCSRFPKCRGRGKWNEVPEARREELERALEAHERANPVPIIRTLGGVALTDAKGKPLASAPTLDVLAGGGGEGEIEEAA